MPLTQEQMNAKLKAKGITPSWQQKQQVVSPTTTPTPQKEDFGSKILKVGKGIFSAVAETAVQPARFLEKTGKAIGMIGLSEEQKQRTEALMGGEKAYRTGKEVVGGAIQAAANLSTPFVGGAGKLALQSAALAGGKALEEDKSMTDVALHSAVGAIGGALLGGATKYTGTLIQKGTKGVSELASKSLKPIAEKIAPYFTGVSKKELDIAFKQYPEKTAANFQILKDAATPQEAESVLRSSLLAKSRAVYQKAKQNVQQTFESGISALNKQFPEARADIPKVAKGVMEELPRFGKPVSADETQALESVLQTLREPREYTIDGTRTLLTDLWGLVERTEQGTPARKAATSAWKGVRQELSTMTKGKADKTLKVYSDFLDKSDELKPLWSENVTEDTARNFVANLTSSNKTASREALHELEKASGERVLPDIDIYRLSQKLAVDQKLTGSRMTEMLLASGVYGVGGGLGEAIGGEKGKAIGQGLGVALGAHALAPSAISNILLSEMKAAAVPVSNVARAKIGKMIADPKMAQVIMRAIQQIYQNPEEK